PGQRHVSGAFGRSAKPKRGPGNSRHERTHPAAPRRAEHRIKWLRHQNFRHHSRAENSFPGRDNTTVIIPPAPPKFASSENHSCQVYFCRYKILAVFPPDDPPEVNTNRTSTLIV